MRVFFSIVVGVLLAIIASKFLFVRSALSLIPWGLAGLVLGYLVRSKKEAIRIGAIYGFVLSFTFMAIGYSGSAPFVTRIPFFTILGLFGAVCGLILGMLGFFVHKLLKR